MTEISDRAPRPEGEVVPVELAEVSAVEALLPALLVDEPDEQVVTDTLLARVEISAQLERLIDGLAELLEQATAPATAGRTSRTSRTSPAGAPGTVSTRCRPSPRRWRCM